MARRKRTPPRADRNAYKSATDRVINHLVAPASRNGPINTHLQETGRAKVDHLPDLAKAVSDGVEDRIFDDIRIAIDGREADLHYHIMQGDSTIEDIARHQHVVSMLREVRGILYAHRRPRIARQPDKANTKQAHSEKDARQNFSRLQLCELSALPLGRAPSTRVSFSKGDRAATLNLLRRFQEVENHVLGLWRSLSEGAGSLLTCGVATNAAYLLMQDLERAFVAAHPLLHSWSRVSEMLEVQVVHSDKMVFVRPRDGSLKHERALGKADAAFETINGIRPAAASLLNDVHNRIKLADQKKTKTSSPLVLEDSCFDFGAILRSQVQEIYADVRSGGRKGARREEQFEFSAFNRGLLEFIRTSQLPMWLVHATAIEQSIYEIVGSEPGLPSDLYLDAVAHMSVQLAPDEWASRQTILPLTRNMQLHFTCRDVMEQNCRSSTNGTQTSAPGKSIAHFMGTPTASMDRLLNVMLDERKAVCEKVNEMGIIIPIAHLYHEGRKAGLFPSPWHDMQTFIDRHGEQICISNDAAIQPYDPLHRFLQALGTPSWKLRAGQVPDFPSQRQIGERCKAIQPTSRCLQLVDAAAEEFRKPDNLEIVIEAIAREETSKLESSGVMEANAATQPSKPIHQLKILQATLLADEPGLNFDYLKLEVQCRSIGERLGLGILDQEVENDNMCARIAYMCFESLVKAKSKSRPVSSTTFWGVCKGINQLISEGESGIGDRLTTKANVSLGAEECKRPRAYDPKHAGVAFEAYLKAKGKDLSSFPAEMIDSSAAGLTFWTPEGAEVDELAELGEKFWQEWEEKPSLKRAGLIEKQASAETSENAS